MCYLCNANCWDILYFWPIVYLNLQIRDVPFLCSLSPTCLNVQPQTAVLMCESATSGVFGGTVFCGAMDSYLLEPCWIALGWNGSTLLPGDIVGIFVPCALGDRGSEYKGCMAHLVSSTCLIYCPAVFEVGQAEFASLGFLVISSPRLQPRWGSSPSTTGYRKYLSLIAPRHTISSHRFPAHDFSAPTRWLIYALTAQTAWLERAYIAWEQPEAVAWWCFNLLCSQTVEHELGVSDVLSDLFSTLKHKPILVFRL